MKKKLLFRALALVTCLISTLSVVAAEAYACYTSSNTTLTFYYDNYRSSRSGTTYNLNTGSNDTGWDTDGTKSSVTKVVFNSSFAGARPTTTYDWFYMMSNLQSITGIEFLNTSQVTNMAYMFYNCNQLTSLDLSSFNTSHVTSMKYMFYGCTNLRTIYVGNDWSTAAVTSSAGMFNNCTSLVGEKGTTYDANHVDKTYARVDRGSSSPGYLSRATMPYACITTSNSTMTFYYDNNWISRSGTVYPLNIGDNYPAWLLHDNESGLSNLNGTRNVVFDSSFAYARPTTTYYWFYGFEELTSITGINNLNTSEVTNMSWMFFNCGSLSSLDLSSLNTAKVTDMSNMFLWCTGLKSLNVSGFNTSNVTDMSFMFQDCAQLTSLDLSSFNTSNAIDMGSMFNECGLLQTIYVGSQWSLASAEPYAMMFRACPALVGEQGTTWDAEHIDASYAHIDGGPSNPGYMTGKKEAYAVYTSSNTTLTFYYDKLRSTRTGTIYDVPKQVVTPAWYFRISPTRVVFDSSFADYRPTSTYYWFYYMEDLESISGLEYLNTSQVTNMNSMFYGCKKLTSLDLSSFNTSNVTNMSFMIAICTSLTRVDLSSFNTSNVTDMTAMFNMCSNLKTLDLSSFNTSKVNRMKWMFSTNPELTTIYVGSGWNTSAVTESDLMFNNCAKIRGEKGTTYDASHIDKAYAHIDGGTSNPGYLSSTPTLKQALNTARGNINFTSTGTYPWKVKTGDGRLYAQSSNKGVHSSTSTITATITVPENGESTLSFDFKAWGEGSSWDVCSFAIDGTTKFSYGARQNDWETYSVGLSAGTHTLKWSYTKDGSVNPEGDYFAIDNVSVVTQGDLYVTVPNIQAHPGSTVVVPAYVTNEIDIAAFQIYFSSDFGVDLTEAEFTERVEPEATLYFNQSDGVLCYNTQLGANAESMLPGNGSAVNLTFKIPSDAEPGEYNYCLNNITFVPSASTGLPSCYIDDVCGIINVTYLKGDLNSDGILNVADVTALIADVLNSSSVNSTVADLNGDGTINVADVTALIKLILNGGMDPNDPCSTGYWLVLLDEDGNKIWYQLYMNSDGSYSTTVSLTSGVFGSDKVRFYYVDNGSSYGAPINYSNIVLDSSSYSNPLNLGESYYTVDARYTYTFSLIVRNSTSRYANANQGNPCN